VISDVFLPHVFSPDGRFLVPALRFQLYLSAEDEKLKVSSHLPLLAGDPGFSFFGLFSLLMPFF